MAYNPGNKKEISRRKFLTYVIGGIGGIVAAAISVPLAGYFLSPAWKKKNELLTPIANVSDIPQGEPTYVTYEHRVRDGWVITTASSGAWVVNQNNNITIYDPRCTHLNCPYYWDKDKQKFLCPCHGGEFDIDGKVVGGPPPRPLDKLEFVIDQGTIQITGKILGTGEVK